MAYEARQDAQDATGRKPVVWALLGHRAGDNLQVEALAEQLGWPWQRKQLDWQPPLSRWSPLYGRAATRKHLRPASAEALRPPWPDLVIAVGWRSVPVARWIRNRCGARLVHLGRPRAPLHLFDLVLTTPQYSLPDAANVIQLDGPLTRLSPERLAASAKAWETVFAALPRPWIAVLIGGDTPPLRLPQSAAIDLASRCDRLAQARQGSLLIATSARTSQAAADSFMSRITVPHHRYFWGKDDNNPYSAYLALADEFVVTSDSVSMIHEASLTGRPLHLFFLDADRTWHHRLLRRIEGFAHDRDGLFSKAYRGLIRNGWIYPPRATERYHEGLVQNGTAVTLGQDATRPHDLPAPSSGQQALEAVRALMA